MNFSQAISSGFSKYASATGRASRSEYWYWTLFATILALATFAIDIFIFPDFSIHPLNTITGLALFLPGVAVAIRRLHDVDRSGWWLLIGISIIGLIPLLIWDCTQGTAGPNRFGSEPLAER